MLRQRHSEDVLRGSGNLVLRKLNARRHTIGILSEHEISPGDAQAGSKPCINTSGLTLGVLVWLDRSEALLSGTCSEQIAHSGATMPTFSTAPAVEPIGGGPHDRTASSMWCPTQEAIAFEGLLQQGNSVHRMTAMIARHVLRPQDEDDLAH